MTTRTYPRVALTADVALFCGSAGDLHVLLIRRGRPPFKGLWALPGGFVNEDERVEDAARRELAEETGIRWTGALAQIGGFGDPGRDPRGPTATIAYWAHVGTSPVDSTAGDDAEYAEWHRVAALPQLAFDHALIVSAALERMRECAGSAGISPTC